MKSLCWSYLLCFLLFAGKSVAQDVPLFSQKLINSFIYNPSLTGVEYGAVTFLHKRGLNKLEGNGTVNYLSFETPIVNKNLGIGANILVEEVNFIRNNYFSISGAYHINLGNLQMLSMGLSAEYTSIKPDLSQVIGDVSDEMLERIQGGDLNSIDFSAGISYRHEHFVAGVGANRLITAINAEDDESLLSQYYTVQVIGKLPVRQSNDLLEPMLSYRKLTQISHLWDIGVYYTMKETITVGGSLRIGSSGFSSTSKDRGINSIGATAAFKIIPEVLIGYTIDIPANKGYQIGLANEITLRYIFNQTTYQKRFNNGRQPSQFKGRYKTRKKRK